MNGGTQERIKDAIAVMSEYCDVLGVHLPTHLQAAETDYCRDDAQSVQYATVPIISLESATLHL
jgi:N-succinyl-L-ornithine transcarbamylase